MGPVAGRAAAGHGPAAGHELIDLGNKGTVLEPESLPFVEVLLSFRTVELVRGLDQLPIAQRVTSPGGEGEDGQEGEGQEGEDADAEQVEEQEEQEEHQGQHEDEDEDKDKDEGGKDEDEENEEEDDEEEDWNAFGPGASQRTATRSRRRVSQRQRGAPGTWPAAAPQAKASGFGSMVAEAQEKPVSLSRCISTTEGISLWQHGR